MVYDEFSTLTCPGGVAKWAVLRMGVQIWSLTREEELAVTSSVNGNLNALEALIQEARDCSDPRQVVGLCPFPPGCRFQGSPPAWLASRP